MATNFHKGSGIPLRQELSEHWDSSQGYSANYTWRGLSETQMRNLAIQYKNVGVAYDIRNQFGVWSLQATDTTGQITIDKWEVNIDEVQPSSLFNPRNTAFLALSDRDKSKFKKALNTDSSWDDTYATMTDTGNSTVLGRLFDRMREGRTQYQKSQMLLRHTTNAPNRWNANIADIGVNMLYAHSSLLSETLSSYYWVYPLPGALEYAITYFHNFYQPVAKANHFWSWLKSGSPRVTVANNRVDIVTQYKLDQWSTDEYATY